MQKRTFHYFPPVIPAGQLAESRSKTSSLLQTEPGVRIRLDERQAAANMPARAIVWVTRTDAEAPLSQWFEALIGPQDTVYICEPRGIGSSRWTTRNPPNYVERAHYLLGETVASGRVWDIAASSRYVWERHERKVPVYLAGEGAAAALAIYAALHNLDIAGLILKDVPASHRDPGAPALLNVLRVCDLPQALGMIAPRPVTLAGEPSSLSETVASIYRAAGAADRFQLQPISVQPK
ncbi:MAG: hypothetical protein U1G07_04845 [Verrucomicrobiota bacterium]